LKPKGSAPISDAQISKFVSKIKARIALNKKAVKAKERERKEAEKQNRARDKKHREILKHFKRLGLSARVLMHGGSTCFMFDDAGVDALLARCKAGENSR
jgi:hypothetical protein